MGTFINLTLWDLGVALILIVLAGAVSIMLQLGIERRLLLSALRCTIQLGMVGMILQQIFKIENPMPVAIWYLLMLVFAAREAVVRSKWRYKGIRIDAMITMAFSTMLVGGIVTQAVIGVKPWYNPQYVIPILGMIFGNSLNGISLCLDRFIENIRTRKDEVELLLAYGATKNEAVSEPLKTAVRTGMIPIINNMAMAGVVSLPGMMTGQILAGSSPIQAVGYQIVVMFMIAASSTLGAMSAATLAGRRLIAPYGMLYLERLEKKI